MASQQSPASHQAPAKSSVAIHCFHRVFRAGGHVAASGRENWRDGPLVSAKQLQRERVEDPIHVREIRLSRQRQIARRLLTVRNDRIEIAAFDTSKAEFLIRIS